MDIWHILGIEETKDKTLIKQAYRKRLQTVNPEDDAEGFMELRAAFEEATKLASLTGEPPKAESSAIYSRIDSLYKDFSRRISEEEWRALLDEDVFVALDTSLEAFAELIRYLMEHYYLPQRVWKLLVSQFDIRERRRELSEQFPSDFIDYMLNNAEYEDLLNYDFFTGDEGSYDAFIESFYRLDTAIRKKEYDAQLKYFGKLEELDVSHPYLEVAHIRRELQHMRDEADEKKQEVKNLFPERLSALEKSAHMLNTMYPDDIVILHACGDLALIQEDTQTAKFYYDQSLALAPERYVVKGKQAELLCCMGEYAKSRDLYMELLRTNHYDNHVRAGMVRANIGLLAQYEKELAEHPDDAHTRIEMAWCHYQNYHFEEVIRVLSDVVPTGKQVFEFFNVRGRSYLCMAEFEKAKDDFFSWKEAVLGLDKEDKSEETEKLRKRLPYIHFLISECFLKTDDYEHARKYLELAISVEHDEILLSYEAKCELEYRTEHYEACMDACESLLARDDRSFLAYMYQAKAQFEMEYFKDALLSCERAIVLYPYVAEPYSLEAQIYIKAGQAEIARQVLDRFRAFGIPSDELDYSDACLLELEDKHEEIVALLEGTLSRSRRETSDKEDFDEIYMMLGYHLEKLGRTEEAIRQYEHVLEHDKKHPLVNGRLGFLYKTLGSFQLALHYFKNQLALREHPVYYMEQGVLMEFLGEGREAFLSFQKALSFELKNIFCLTRIGLLCESGARYKEAYRYLKRAYDYTDDAHPDERKGIHAYIARVLQGDMQLAQSRQWYEEYLERYGWDADIIYDYTELLMRMDNSAKAIDVLYTFIKKNDLRKNGMQACVRQMIFICGQEGKLNLAREAYRRLALSGAEIAANTYAVLGRACFQNEAYSEAVKHYERAVELDKNLKENYYSELVEAMTSKRLLFRTKKMTEVFKTAQDSFAKRKLVTPSDCVKLARLLRCMGASEDAVRVLDKAFRIKRCSGCFYRKCHCALYEKALNYEAKGDFETARMCLKEAISVCGHQPLYEKRLKRINNK